MSRIVTAFEKELKMVGNSAFRKHIINIMEQCPNYILNIPSSSTGKYHPEDEVNVPDGQSRHIKRCCIIADEIARMNQHSDIERDILIASCLLHDIFKNGKTTDKIDANGFDVPSSKYTQKNHPVLIHNLIQGYVVSDVPIDEEMAGYLELLSNVCLFHEGQWTEEASKTVFRKKNKKMNETGLKLCNSMHIVDYVASRRTIWEAMQKGWYNV